MYTSWFIQLRLDSGDDLLVYDHDHLRAAENSAVEQKYLLLLLHLERKDN